MNIKFRQSLALTLICLLIFCACAAPISPANTSTIEEDNVLLTVHEQYRSSSLVISGICTQSHINANDELCYDVTIDEVFAGNAEVNDILHCSSRHMNIDEKYLLFLSAGEDVHHAEDTPGYDLLTEAPIQIVNESLSINNKPIRVEALREELSSLKSVINAPAPIYFFSDLSALTLASDEIFIGKVMDMPALKEHSFTMRNGGSIEKAQNLASIVKVEAYGSIKGILNYGDVVDMVFCPQNILGMLDSATLQPTDYPVSTAVELKQNGVYLFFLVNGPDEKQNYLFPVNAIQGFTEISGEKVVNNKFNTPFSEYNELSPLVVAVRQAILDADVRTENPGLVVVEE